MADDLFVAMVKGDAARADEVAKVEEVAATVDAHHILNTSTSTNHAARRISMAAIAVRESRRDELMAAVETRVGEQADALKRSDPTNLRVLTDADIAEHRAAKVKASG